MLSHEPMILAVILCVVTLVFQNVPEVNAFLIPSRQHSLYFGTSRSQHVIVGSSTKPRTNSGSERSKKEKKQFTLKDLAEEIQKKPSAFLGPGAVGKSDTQKQPRRHRTRKRVENPQQQYLYAKQRQALAREGKLDGSIKGAEEGNTTSLVESLTEAVPVALAKEYGLTQPAAQHCDALVDAVQPFILGRIRVGEELTSGSYAYIIDKPAGWAILGGAPGKKAPSMDNDTKVEATTTSPSPSKRNEPQIIRLEITDEDGSLDVHEFSEASLLAVMSPEEIEEYKAELRVSGKSRSGIITQKVQVRVDDDDEEEEGYDEDYDAGSSFDDIGMENFELLSDMTPEDLEVYEREVGPLPDDFLHQGATHKEIPYSDNDDINVDSKYTAKDGQPTQTTLDAEIDPETALVYSKIEARKSSAKSNKASFAPFARPSIVAWLKDLKAKEGTPMKGGKYWTAVAGATDVDDSGIVVLCPKEYTENVFVDYLEYLAVIGNNNDLAPKLKGVESIAKGDLTMEILSTLKRGRTEDIVQTVKVMVPEKLSSCSSIVHACQEQFQDGIRGDPAGNPLCRLANRRLVHCMAVSVSSLVHDESIEVETEGVTDDIAVLADRRNQHQFQEGSFLGRSALKNNPLTTAYREINGAADGFPGWTVDRYDKWLFVQHDDKMPRGPLPSIHDGATVGVYYLPANPDRSAMGSSSSAAADSVLTRPRLLEGQAAPDIFPVVENGVTYHVSLDKDLSTGLFLDQRPQRAWLARNCNEETHVLNCFAHCGGFSIAAATAGASTTSIDLSKKWLGRVEPQLKANGIEFDVRHDCIYGDCEYY
jgi:S-adenosylmethionine-dependent methyltransferase